MHVHIDLIFTFPMTLDVPVYNVYHQVESKTFVDINDLFYT